LFLSSCDVRHVKSSLYYPQSNGLIERFNSSVKQAVRTAVAGGKAPDVAVREMLVAFRSTPQPATGVTPAQLMLGRQIRVPANSLISHFLSGKKTVKFADDKDALQAVKDNVERQQEVMAKQFNRRHRACHPKVKVGDWVRVHIPKGRTKTAAAFSEPHKVLKFVAPFTVMLDNNKRWHLSKLKKCPAPSTADDDDGAWPNWDEDAAELPLAGDHLAEDLPGGDHTLVKGLPPVVPPARPLRRSTRQSRLPHWHGDFI
jgi:hypothetical protein